MPAQLNPLKFFIFLLLVASSLQAYCTDFTVTNTGNSGSGSLREAMTLANASTGPHTIRFNIPQSDPGFDAQKGIWTIAPTYPLPYIMKAGVTIDGTTQTTNQGNTNANGPEIMLFGNSTVDFGFSVMNVPDAVIKGFIISGFIYGIQVTGNAAANNTITGNYIGVNYNASDTIPNYIGVEILGGAHHNIIGSAAPADRNIISGNSHIGLRLLQSSYNIVKNNYVGTDRTGTFALHNYDGISLEGYTQYNILGGLTAAERNLVSGNVAYGIPLIGLDTRYNEIKGNYIGTNADGSAAIPNTYGILFDDGSRFNKVGGYEQGAANLISGNSGYGVFIYNLGTMYNEVIGNLIGTDKTGTAAVPNSNGIVCDGAAKYHFIDSNVISGNVQQGIAIHVAGTDGHKITRNKIGVDVTGVTALPNTEDGIRIAEGCRSNVIGVAPDSGNIIAWNGGNGINIMTGADMYNKISGNSTYKNTGLGIELYFPGPNPNDAGDMDTGPNMGMNYPVIQNVTYNSLTGVTTVSGNLDTYLPQNAVVDLFLSDDYSNGYGQGQVYLTSVSPQADGNFTVIFNHPLTLTKLCATATDSLGNTSEFSAQYNLPPPASVFHLNKNAMECTLFPNPATEFISLRFDRCTDTPIHGYVFNYNLKMVDNFIINKMLYNYPCRNLPAGHYYFLITDEAENIMFTKKWIKL